MAVDIQPLSQPAPSGVKFIYGQKSTGLYYRVDTQALEAWNDTNYAHYQNTAVQQGTSGIWQFTTPAVMAALDYFFVAKIVVDGTPLNDQNAGAGQTNITNVIYVTPGSS